MRTMVVAALLVACGAALAQTGTQPRQPGERVFVDPHTGEVVRFRQIERPGQAPLFQVNPAPLPAHERGALLRQAEQSARQQQQAGQGRGSQGNAGQGSRHNVRGGSPTQPTWNQNPADRRAYTAQDAAADAARSDAARRAEMARRGLQWWGN